MVCGVLRGLWSYRDSKELKCSTIITDVRNRATGINIYHSTSYYSAFFKLVCIKGNYSTRSNLFSDKVELWDSRRCQGVRSSVGDCWEEYRYATSSQVYHNIVIVKKCRLVITWFIRNDSLQMFLSEFQVRRRRVHGLWIIRRRWSNKDGRRRRYRCMDGSFYG